MNMIDIYLDFSSLLGRIKDSDYSAVRLRCLDRAYELLQLRYPGQPKKANGQFTFGKKSVDNSGESGIINENSNNGITIISEEAISHVPFVEIAGYTAEQNKFIQQQHQELLKYARDNNESKEVAFVFDSCMKGRKIYKGTDDRIEFGGEIYGKDFLIMHNHPRNSSYSFSDTIEFVANDSIKTLSIVKNNGSIETLTKTALFDKKSLLTELKRLKKNNIKTGDDGEYRKIVDKFLDKYNGKGVFEWKKAK